MVDQKLKFASYKGELSVNNYSMYSNAVFVTIFILNDSKATPDNYFEGYDGVLQSLLISVNPDGDYYTESDLYKIEGVLNPKIIKIEELKYPNFKINIEYGITNKRKEESFYFKADFE